MESPWRRLSLPKQDGLPLLLYKLHTTSKSYEIYITDLTQLWREQLSYKQVLKRAEEDDTTIDPSEDPGQFAVLLQKIDEALQNSPGSSMALTPGRGPEPDSLHLQLCIKLPGPLKPLKWNLYLSKRPYTESTDHLLLSLLREERDSEMRQRTLLEHLKQKDWVLAKLFDKIEAMGIDLSTIFPGTSGLRGTRKETSLAQASKYIKGVAPFNEQEWLVGNQSPLGASLAQAVSGATSDESGVNGLQPPPDKWWESLEARSSVGISPEPDEQAEEPVPKEPETTNQMDIDTASEDDDDEFERQETPPRLKKHAPAAENPQPSPSPAKKSQSPPQNPQRNPSRGLGRIGRGAGNKTKPRQPSRTPSTSPSPPPKRPSSPPQPEQQVGSAAASTASSPDLDRRSTKQPSPTRAAQEDQETDSGSGSDDELQPSRPSPSKQHAKDTNEGTPQKNKSRRGVLGVIGGKKKEKETRPSSSPPPVPSPKKPQSPEQPKPKRTSKLGVIGGKSKPKPKPELEPDHDTHTHTHTYTTGDSRASNNQLSSPDMEMRPKSKQAVKGKEDEDGDGKQSVGGVKKEAESKHESKHESVPEPEQETEEQKADRKREELKRQLEAKSKAPVKKRRKF